MHRYLLDTDTFSLFLRGHPQVIANVFGRRRDFVTTTIITVEEELGGWYSLLRKTKDAASLARAYQRMTDTVECLASFSVMSFSEAAIRRFEMLRKLHPRIGGNDLRIAAIAMDSGLTLVTRNLIDFAEVEGLTIENWAN